MPSERVQRKIDQLLEQAEAAIDDANWALVRARCEQALALDPDSADAHDYLAAAARATASATVPSASTDRGSETASDQPATRPSAGAGASPALEGEALGNRQSAVDPPAAPTAESPASNASGLPTAFDNGRYTVKRFLGEGGKKKVYLAHDTMLDRDVAFALIKTEGLDDIGRERISREGQPFMVTELMGGGDVEGLIEKAPDHKLALEQALRIADEVCQGLEFAHSQNIVHRDLKPGNVWLTEAIGNRQSAVGDGVGTATQNPG